jgi:ribosomal protein S18 acetylase RimI-like enzyme
MEQPPVKIRRISLGDLGKITRMTYENMAGADKQFTRLLRNPLFRWGGYLTLPLDLLLSGQGYKATHRGRIIGCAFLQVREYSGYVFNVSVNRSYRRLGVGSQLMKHLEEITRGRGRRWMGLQVDNGNLPAQRLYSHLGYRAYHPRFLYLDGAAPIQKALTTGLAIEPLIGYQGRRLYRRYLQVEQEAGDAWASSVLKEYDQNPPSGGQFWRCRLHQEEIGCAWESGSTGRPAIRLALKPAYWGHITSSGLVKLLAERLSRVRAGMSVYMGSSDHHEAAAPLLGSIGFEVRRQARILMLKPLS